MNSPDNYTKIALYSVNLSIIYSKYPTGMLTKINDYEETPVYFI